MKTISPLRWRRALGLEACLCLLAVGLCVGQCVRSVPWQLDKVRGVEIFSQVQESRLALAEQLAETGELPAGVALPLGLRPAWSIAESGGHLLWRCGDRAVPPGWQASGEAPSDERTALAATYYACREGKTR